MPPTNSIDKKDVDRVRRTGKAGKHMAEPMQTHTGASAAIPTGLIQRIQGKPQTLNTTDVSYLQRTAGNRAVADMLGRGPQRAPSGGVPISRPTITGSQPLIQRALDENGKSKVYNIVRVGRNEVFNTFAGRKRSDPAANSLLRLAEATAGLAEAARDHDKATPDTIGKIDNMFKSLSALARLGQGGGYVDPKKYEKQMGSMWNTLNTSAGMHNLYHFKGVDTEGLKLEGLKRAMGYIGGGLMNIFLPLYIGGMHVAMGKSSYHAKQAVNAYDTLNSDDNNAYTAPLREFRESAEALAKLDGSFAPKKPSSPPKHSSKFDNYVNSDPIKQTSTQGDDFDDFGESDDFMRVVKKPEENTLVKSNSVKEDMIQNSPLPPIQRQTVRHIQRFSFGREKRGAVHVAYDRVMKRLEQFLMKRNAQALTFMTSQEENMKRARHTQKVGKGQAGVYKSLFGMGKKKGN